MSVPTHEFFWEAASQPTAQLGGTEMTGAQLGGQGETTLLAQGEGALVVLLNFKTGFLQPGHSHPDHESYGYVISGKLRMVVGDVEQTLGPGASWWHPKGMHHITEALEPSQAIEIHVPPREDILDRFVGAT